MTKYSNQRSGIQTIYRYIPALIWAFSIAFASSEQLSAQETISVLERLLEALNWQWSSYDLALGNFILRKSVHLVVFGIQGLLFLFALWPKEETQNRLLSLFLLSLGLTACVACWDEWHQSHLLSRSGSISDIALDVLGASFFVGGILWMWAKKNRESPPGLIK